MIVQLFTGRRSTQRIPGGGIEGDNGDGSRDGIRSGRGSGRNRGVTGRSRSGAGTQGLGGGAKVRIKDNVTLSALSLQDGGKYHILLTGAVLPTFQVRVI